MEKTKELLKEMIGIAGLSGYEAPIHDMLHKAWQPLTDELHSSKIGSLHGLKRGNTPDKGKGQRTDALSSRPSVMIATHMDAIGLMVTKVEGEFLHFTQIGGIDPRVIAGIPVTVHGIEKLPGIVVIPPMHTLPEAKRHGAIGLHDLRVDTGLRAKEVGSKVRVGDLISFATEPTELDGGYLTGHSLDNRASVAVLTEALRILQSRTHHWDVWATATVQEEVGLIGAYTSAYALRPTLAIVIDVTFAQGPGAIPHEAWKLDKGPTLDWGANTHPKLHGEIEKLAKQLEIPYQNAYYERHSGTDAYATQVSAEGIPTMLMCVPLRYMHTPVEMIQYKDIERLARLLAELITTMDADFMDKLKWDEEIEDEEKGDK